MLFIDSIQVHGNLR